MKYETVIDGLTTEIGTGVYRISDCDLSIMYLIVGTEKALLIDTGIGLYGLDERIKMLTDLPLTVALTHGHVDHIGGAGMFKEVYVHPADYHLKSKMDPRTRKTFAIENVMSLFKYKLKLSDIRDFGKPEFLDLTDGFEFCLGDRTVTFYHTPGHTKGSGCFFDSKTKYLFTGDTSSKFSMILFSESDTMSVYNESLKKLYDLQSVASKSFGGHTFSSPLSPSTTKQLIRITDRILNSNKKPKLGAKFGLVPFASLLFSKDKIKE